MGLKKDITILAGLLLILSSVVVATGVIDLPGTNNVDVPGGDDSSDSRYKFSTSIQTDGQLTQASLRDRSFSYDTEKCGVLGCRGLSFTETPLFALGADQVEMNIELFRKDGEKSIKVAEAKKYIGSIEWTQTKTVKQSFSNIRSGTYAVRYTLSGQGAFEFTEVETFRAIVPETVVEGGGQ